MFFVLLFIVVKIWKIIEVFFDILYGKIYVIEYYIMVKKKRKILVMMKWNKLEDIILSRII